MQRRESITLPGSVARRAPLQLKYSGVCWQADKLRRMTVHRPAHTQGQLLQYCTIKG